MREADEPNDIHIIHSYPQRERPSTTVSVDSLERNKKNVLQIKRLCTYKQSYPQKRINGG